MRNMVKIFLVIFLFSISFVACYKNNLNVPPLGQLSESEIANKRGVEKLLIGAYSMLDGFGVQNVGWGAAASNWTFGSICGSEAYKGSDELDQLDITSLAKFTTLPINSYVGDKWKAAYYGVQRANDVLRILKKATNISSSDSIEFAAEARFLRGHFHFEAKKMWNNIPYIDESVTYESGNFHVPNDTSWLPIEKDLLYAVNHLPARQDAIGRINFYTAEALLAKAYMFQHKYADARPLLKDIIDNGVNSLGVPFRLTANFGDSFNPAHKNGSESVFVAQASVNDGSFGSNGNVGDALNYPYTGGPGTCCGFFQPSQFLVNHFKTDSLTGLPDLDHFNDKDKDVTSDQGKESTDLFTPYSGTLDPRLDRTVGRRGVPYLDWGPHPGKAWIRDRHQAEGPYSPIKTVFYRSQQGTPLTENNSWAQIMTANTINLIRFADVLLWAAEVEVEIGNLNNARDYVNEVRTRAADPSWWVKNDDNIPYANSVTNSQAEFDLINDPSFTNIQPLEWVVRKDLNQTWVAIQVNPDGTKTWDAYSPPNYKISLYQDPWTDPDFARKAIRYERVLELGMEGQRFFDLVRWGIAETEINAYFDKEQTLREDLIGAKFYKNKDEYFPIPQVQITLSAGSDGVEKLKQNPGY